MDILDILMDSQKKMESGNVLRTSKNKSEMSVLARSSVKKASYTRNDICPDTIIKALNCTKNIWHLIATNIVDDPNYIDFYVSFAYEQLDYLMDKYKNNNNAYRGDPLYDLSDATKRLMKDRPAYYEVEEINPKETHFIYTIDCRAVDNKSKQILIGSFNKVNQISRIENNLKCETSVSIVGDEIKITISFSVV